MKGEPVVTVRCDECGEEVELGLTSCAGNSYDGRNFEPDLERMGWTTNGEKDLCEDCSIKNDGEVGS